MRVLLFFGGDLAAARGTPSRARNMGRSLAARSDVELLAVSRAARSASFDFEHWPLEDRSLDEVVRGFRPDVVYGHTHKALDPLSRLAGVTRVVDLHGNPVAEKLEEYWRPFHRRLRSATSLWWLEKRRLASVDAYTTVSRWLARRVEAKGLPVKVVWGGVDPEIFRPSERTSTSRLAIGYAGNFRPYQGLPTLLEAARRLVDEGTDLELTLVGDPGETGVDRTAKESLGDRVHLVGLVPYAEVPESLAKTNVLVIPRPHSKPAVAGFPSKLPEYMAMGKALVVTDVGEQGEVVIDEESGLVVPPASPTALARALGRLRDSALRDRLGAAARRAATDSLDWDILARGIQRFFAALIAKR